jgi:hypothetical protein
LKAVKVGPDPAGSIWKNCGRFGRVQRVMEAAVGPVPTPEER